MVDISTSYMGIPLRSPIIVGSSGLTDSSSKIAELEDKGAGAVVLKSIFEEEIAYELEAILSEASSKGFSLEQFDYYDYEIKGEKLAGYEALIKESKKAVSIPVIASVNCTYSHEWISFAERIEAAGADGIELNMFFLPSDFSRSSEEKELVYFDIIKKIRETVSIPISLKISYYFSNLGPMIKKLSETGISGLVLFNRFFSPDIDIDSLKIKSSNLFSSPAEVSLPLRWIAFMSGKVSCDLVASTGVHDGQAAIKQLLAGANAIQTVSALYIYGTDYLKQMHRDIETWMKEHNYHTINNFKGMLSQAKSDNPAVYERVQFMKYYGLGRD